MSTQHDRDSATLLATQLATLRSELAAANLRIENHARLIKGYQDELAGVRGKVGALTAEAAQPQCWCLTCRPIDPFKDPGSVRMALCPKCGNKRCPKANDHRQTCTGSNEPGQPGSAYPTALKGGTQ